MSQPFDLNITYAVPGDENLQPQLFSRPSTEKGSKIVAMSEKRETITVLVRSYAEGMFLSPYVLMKRVYKKQEQKDNMVRGSKVGFSKKSTYVNAEIFFEYLAWYRCWSVATTGPISLQIFNNFQQSARVLLQQISYSPRSLRSSVENEAKTVGCN